MSISKDIIKQCLMNKQREIDEAEIINRPIEFEPNGNYVIVGVRHAGKSYMLYQRVRQLQAEGKGWDEILFIDFEDERLAEFQTEDFNSLLEAHLELYGKKPIVFLDEVQNIPVSMSQEVMPRCSARMWPLPLADGSSSLMPILIR